MKTIHSNHKKKLAALTFCVVLAIPIVHFAQPARAAIPQVADGKTAVLTPEGTLITPPPGAPLGIVANADEVTTVVNGTPWGTRDLFAPTPPHAALSSCSDYAAGWYETNNNYIWGGHAGIKPTAVSTANMCSGTGMGYTDFMAFGGENSWIQAGIVIFPGETSAKWMCQVNNNGALTTKYGPANAYSTGSSVYTWFARDSSGVWRTYRYDTGPYSVELGCTIARGDSAGEPLQAFGEIQGATSTLAAMGPWAMFDLRYEGTDGNWYVPSQLQAHYHAGTPCPPYGAGTVLSGQFVAGTGQACSTGTSSYP